MILESRLRMLCWASQVQPNLRAAEEQYESRYLLKAKGDDLMKIAERVGQITGIEPARIWEKGKNPKTVQARILLCFWACRELGMRTTELPDSL